MPFTPDKTVAQMFSAASAWTEIAAASTASGLTADARGETAKATAIKETAHVCERLDEVIRLLTP